MGDPMEELVRETERLRLYPWSPLTDAEREALARCWDEWLHHVPPRPHEIAVLVRAALAAVPRLASGSTGEREEGRGGNPSRLHRADATPGGTMTERLTDAEPSWMQADALLAWADAERKARDAWGEVDRPLGSLDEAQRLQARAARAWAAAIKAFPRLGSPPAAGEREEALVDLMGDMLQELIGMDGRPHMPSMKTLVQWQHRYDELLPTFADVRGILAPAPRVRRLARKGATMRRKVLDAKVAVTKLRVGKAITEDEARALMRQFVDRDYGGNLRAAARQWDVSAAYLCDYLGGRRKLGPALQRVAGLQREVVIQYRAPAAGASREGGKG